MGYKVTLDPGHGGAQNLGLNGYYESMGNLAACLLLKKELEAHGIEVFMTRETDNTNPNISTQRGQLAIKTSSDLFISWHSDANANKNIRGVTVFNSVKRSGSVDLAEKLAATIAATMGIPLSPYAAAKNGVMHKGNGAGADYYAVLRGATSSGNVDNAMLIEHGFHTHPADVAVLDSGARRAELAKAEARCIAEYFGVLNDTPPVPAHPPAAEGGTGKLYRVQTGAFGCSKNAEAYAAKLKKAGYKTVIKKEGSLYKVQLGAFASQKNAEAFAAALKAAGYPAIVV